MLPIKGEKTRGGCREKKGPQPSFAEEIHPENQSLNALATLLFNNSSSLGHRKEVCSPLYQTLLIKIFTSFQVPPHGNAPHCWFITPGFQQTRWDVRGWSIGGGEVYTVNSGFWKAGQFVNHVMWKKTHYCAPMGQIFINEYLPKHSLLLDSWSVFLSFRVHLVCYLYVLLQAIMRV